MTQTPPDLTTNSRTMDPEEIEYPIKAPDFLPLPFNHAEFRERFEEGLALLNLPFDVCCQGGSPERDTISVETLEFGRIDKDVVPGFAILTFDEYDPSHFTDGPRRVRLDFRYYLTNYLLIARCRGAESDDGKIGWIA